MTDKEQILKLEEKRYECLHSIHLILDKHLGEDEGQWHWVSEWDCDKSPVGLCVYNPFEDRAKDFCIYCGNPNERK
jgi:hypothetical protein